jgi:hypothetical protein
MSYPHPTFLTGREKTIFHKKNKEICVFRFAEEKRTLQHWAKRMGNKNINVKTSRGTNMSTVGVDIGDWVYEKKVRNQSSHGPVIFRTWDFGGQKE